MLIKVLVEPQWRFNRGPIVDWGGSGPKMVGGLEACLSGVHSPHGVKDQHAETSYRKWTVPRLSLAWQGSPFLKADHCGPTRLTGNFWLLSDSTSDNPKGSFIVKIGIVIMVVTIIVFILSKLKENSHTEGEGDNSWKNAVRLSWGQGTLLHRVRAPNQWKASLTLPE